MKARVVIIIAGLVVLAVFLPGCVDMGTGKYTGGGWIPSAADPEARATFGFTFVAEDTDGDGDADTAKGQVQYRDQAAGVAFHGNVEGARVNKNETPVSGEAAGTYIPQPRRAGDPGSFYIKVVDRGEPGPSNDDEIEVLLSDGVHDGYANQQTLGGGNVQYHPDK